MSKLLDQLKDDELDFTVSFSDTDANKVRGEFLDIVCFEGKEYVIIAPDDGDGYVDIFLVISSGDEESYKREDDDRILDSVFEIFRVKNEDEFDFE